MSVIFISTVKLCKTCQSGFPKRKVINNSLLESATAHFLLFIVYELLLGVAKLISWLIGLHFSFLCRYWFLTRFSYEMFWFLLAVFDNECISWSSQSQNWPSVTRIHIYTHTRTHNRLLPYLFGLLVHHPPRRASPIFSPSSETSLDRSSAGDRGRILEDFPSFLQPVSKCHRIRFWRLNHIFVFDASSDWPRSMCKHRCVWYNRHFYLLHWRPWTSVCVVSAAYFLTTRTVQLDWHTQLFFRWSCLCDFPGTPRPGVH